MTGSLPRLFRRLQLDNIHTEYRLDAFMFFNDEKLKSHIIPLQYQFFYKNFLYQLDSFKVCVQSEKQLRYCENFWAMYGRPLQLFYDHK